MVVAVAVAALLAARGARAAGCTPGQQINCGCPGGGSTGIQTCNAQGTGFEPCVCSAPPAPEQSAPGDRECTKDGDCPGDDACVRGKCKAPRNARSTDEAPEKAEARPSARLSDAKLGGIHVGAESAGTVFIDGESKGSTPVDVTNLSPGTYRIRVVMEGGGEYEETVEVVAGETVRVFAEPSQNHIAFQARKGVRFGFSVGAGAWAIHELEEFEEPGGYGLLEGFVNFGLSKAIDVRVGARGQVGIAEGVKFMTLFGVPASVRFNLGSIYTMWIGANLGVRTANPRVYTSFSCGTYSTCYSEERKSDVGLYAGPEFSVATFRFGAKRQFELSLSHGVMPAVTHAEGVPSDALLVLYNSIAFAMLVL